MGTSERVQWGGGGSCQSLKWTPSKKTSLMFTWCWDREAGYKGVIRRWRDPVWILPLHLQILDLETPQLRKSNKLISLMLLLGGEGGNFTLHRIAQVGHFPASASVGTVPIVGVCHAGPRLSNQVVLRGLLVSTLAGADSSWAEDMIDAVSPVRHLRVAFVVWTF